MLRTSISIPAEMKFLIASHAHAKGISRTSIILQCLALFKRNQRKIKASKRGTTKYNCETCSEKMYLYLPGHMHNYVQGIRYAEKISVSYLIFLAVEKYLTGISAKRKSQTLFRHFGLHRRFAFHHRRIAGLSVVFARGPTSRVPR